MTGDGTDESMLRDIRHLGHRSGGREAVWVMVLICGPGLFLVIKSGLSGFLYYAVGLAVLSFGIGAGLLVMNWIGRMDARERASLESEVRGERAREAERAIAEAKAAGDFDRWKK